MQLDGKPELQSSEELQAAYTLPGACLQGALLLVATQDGQGLSPEAAAAASLVVPPAGPTPLPMVGNLMLYMKVGRAVIAGAGAAAATSGACRAVPCL